MPAQIPILDISPSNPHAASSLLSAFRTHGFAYISAFSSTIPSSTTSSLFSLSASFFSSPLSIKSQCPITNNHGYSGLRNESLDPSRGRSGDVKESFNLGDRLDAQDLCGILEQRRGELVAFQSDCQRLCARILEVLEVALGVREGWFRERHHGGGETGSVLRLLHYPPLERDGGGEGEDGEDVRAGAHSDYGSVTLLFQQMGQPGLQVRGADGEWEDVEVDPAGKGEVPVLVNIGDLLSYWTGGLLRSTVHRVVFPRGTTGDRYSVAYFCHPLNQVELEPVPSEMVREFASENGEVDGGGRTLTAKDHLLSRLEATYGKK
ncbi:hypothetical protein MBLNU457_5887t1 [Dothideomycetes sp. NU457]